MSYFPMGKTGSIVRIKQKISRLKVNRHWSRTFQALWCLFWRSPSSFSRLKICMATGQPHCWSVWPASASVPTLCWTEHHKATRKTPHASSSPPVTCSAFTIGFESNLNKQARGGVLSHKTVEYQLGQKGMRQKNRTRHYQKNIWVSRSEKDLKFQQEQQRHDWGIITYSLYSLYSGSHARGSLQHRQSEIDPLSRDYVFKNPRLCRCSSSKKQISLQDTTAWNVIKFTVCLYCSMPALDCSAETLNRSAKGSSGRRSSFVMATQPHTAPCTLCLLLLFTTAPQHTCLAIIRWCLFIPASQITPYCIQEASARLLK